MNRWQILAAFALAALGSIFVSETAFAQATRTWVSGVGDDANPCSRTAPCKTYAGAISKTAAGGEINTLDPGGFGSVTITKAITIDASNTKGGILNAGTTGVIVNAGANDVVVLRGLDFDSASTGTGFNGVRFHAGGALHIEDSLIRDNKSSAADSGFGVRFAPLSGTPKLFISNTRITGNGVGSTGGGVKIEPSGAAGASVTILNSSIDDNTTGLRVVASASGVTEVTVTDSSASGNAFQGITVVGGGGAVNVMIDGVVASNNGTNGIRVTGTNAVIELGRSVVSGNATGLEAVSSGQLQSYGNNFVNGNANDGAPSSVIAPK